MGTGLRLRARDAKENPAKVLAMVLFIMFIISALLLLLLALLLYRLELSEAVVKVAVIVIYGGNGLFWNFICRLTDHKGGSRH